MLYDETQQLLQDVRTFLNTGETNIKDSEWI